MYLYDKYRVQVDTIFDVNARIHKTGSNNKKYPNFVYILIHIDQSYGSPLLSKNTQGIAFLFVDR